jgi:menaquinone-dependent protoporphyrinogen oxidase
MLPLRRVGQPEGEIMTHILVTYATKTGCTQGVAEKIGEVLGEAGVQVSLAAAADAPDPGDFDAVIVGSGVRAGHWHRQASKWVEAHAGALADRPLALFTVGLTMADKPEKADEVRAYTDALLEKTGLKPADIGLFAGWFKPGEFGFLGRTILKKMKAREGDHRDWDAIAAWTREVQPKLSV